MREREGKEGKGKRTGQSCSHCLVVLAYSSHWLDAEFGTLELPDAHLSRVVPFRRHDAQCSGRGAERSDNGGSCYNGGNIARR